MGVYENQLKTRWFKDSLHWACFVHLPSQDMDAMSKELQKFKQQEENTPEIGEAADFSLDSSSLHATDIQEPGAS